MRRRTDKIESEDSPRETRLALACSLSKSMRISFATRFVSLQLSLLVSRVESAATDRESSAEPYSQQLASAVCFEALRQSEFVCLRA